MDSDNRKRLEQLTNIPKLDDPFSCPRCGFEGTVMDTIERAFRESDGRHTRGGTRFSCKQCNEVAFEVINVIS